jgi:hypothetical protein
MRTPSRWSALAAKERNGEEKFGHAPRKKLCYATCACALMATTPSTAGGRARVGPQHVERKTDVNGGNTARTRFGLSAAKEENSKPRDYPEACRSKPPYATGRRILRQSGAAGLPWP